MSRYDKIKRAVTIANGVVARRHKALDVCYDINRYVRSLGGTVIINNRCLAQPVTDTSTERLCEFALAIIGDVAAGVQLVQ